MQCNRAKIVTVINDAGRAGHPCTKIVNLNKDPTLFAKINSEFITDLNVEHETIKHTEDNIEENPDDPGYVDDF